MPKGIPIELKIPTHDGAVSIVKQPKQTLPIDIGKLKDTTVAEDSNVVAIGFSGARNLNPFEEGSSGNGRSIEITDFPEEMQGCIELEEELDRYFSFLSKLDRDELLAIVKYEVYNRVLMQRQVELEKTDE